MNTFSPLVSTRSLYLTCFKKRSSLEPKKYVYSTKDKRKVCMFPVFADGSKSNCTWSYILCSVFNMFSWLVLLDKSLSLVPLKLTFLNILCCSNSIQLLYLFIKILGVPLIIKILCIFFNNLYGI